MKKTMKRIAVTGTVLLALFGAGTGIALASGYITWGGTQDFEQTLINLNLIGERGQELKTANENIGRELEQKHNELLDKDNQIDSLEQEIEALEKRIEGSKTTQDQLKQAEKDFKHVREETESVLEGMQ